MRGRMQDPTGTVCAALEGRGASTSLKDWPPHLYNGLARVEHNPKYRQRKTTVLEFLDESAPLHSPPTACPLTRIPHVLGSLFAEFMGVLSLVDTRHLKNICALRGQYPTDGVCHPLQSCRVTPTQPMRLMQSSPLSFLRFSVSDSCLLRSRTPLPISHNIPYTNPVSAF